MQDGEFVVIRMSAGKEYKWKVEHAKEIYRRLGKVFDDVKVPPVISTPKPKTIPSLPIQPYQPYSTPVWWSGMYPADPYFGWTVTSSVAPIKERNGNATDQD